MANSAALGRVGLAAPPPLSPRGLVIAFHRAHANAGLLDTHRMARIDWMVEDIERRLLTHVTMALTYDDGTGREPLLFRVGRMALTAYSLALDERDPDRLRVLVGAGLEALEEALRGVHLEAAHGRRWSAASARALSTWLEAAGPIGSIRIVATVPGADPDLVKAQLLRRCLPPELRRVVQSR